MPTSGTPEQVGGGPQTIAGENAESAAVGGDIRIKAYLHREVGHGWAE